MRFGDITVRMLYHIVFMRPQFLENPNEDNRKEYKQTEVTIDYNAGFTGATAGLLYYIELNYISGL